VTSWMWSSDFKVLAKGENSQSNGCWIDQLGWARIN